MNLINGFKDSLDILTLRWRMIRSRRAQIFMTLIFLGGAFMIYNLGNLAAAVRSIAANPTAAVSTEVRALILSFIQSLIYDGAAFAVTGSLAALAGATILIPLIGYSFSSLVPASDLVSVRKNDSHKLSDSIILQFLSVISIVQLLVLTTLNSLLSIESTHPGVGIVYGGMIWVDVVLLTAFFAWVFEFLTRKYGVRSKFIAVGIVAVVLGVVFLFNSGEVGTLFGLSTAYSTFIVNAGAQPLWVQLLVLLGFVASWAVIGLGITFAGSKALSLPESKRKKMRKRRIKVNPNTTSISQTRFLLSIVMRQSNIWKPLLMAGGFTFISVMVFAGSAQVLSSLVFIVPLIVSMSWGVNTFGIIGGGITWLVSQPSSKLRMLYSILAVQLLLILAFLVIVLIPLIFIHHLDLSLILSFVVVTAFISVIMSRSALSKAVLQPERYQVHIRGENVLPPGKALNYLGRFVLGPGFLGIILFWSGALPIQLGALAFVLIWQGVRFARLQKRWQEDPTVIENIVKRVGY